MERRLFISGSGSSELIRELLGETLCGAGGFVTRSRLSTEGRVIAEEIMPAAAAAGVEGLEGRCFVDYSVMPPRADNEVLRGFGVQLLREAQYYPFVLLDEFGGHELLIPQFRAELTELLNSGVPCIGVIKTERSARELQRSFRLGGKYLDYVKQLRRALKSDPDTRLVLMKRPGDRRAAEAVRQWVEKYAR